MNPLKTGLLCSLIATILLVVPNRLHAQVAPSVTITNPTPSSFDYFGSAVAAVGTGRVLIGAIQDNNGVSFAGAAYLYNANGTLLITITNPSPTLGGEEFGSAVTAVGLDKLLIGCRTDATNGTSGAAYLYSTNGTLLTVFTNPPPSNGDGLGYAVAAVGAGRVLIGAPGDDTGSPQAGSAYLFSTNGTLLTTFINPNPTMNAQFGNAVAVVGPDKLLIGTPASSIGAPGAGAAYLFSTNGIFNTNNTPMITFTNPTPFGGDEFGIAVAAVGTDRVLIGARMDDTGATDTGAAYLFSTNGTLLTTFTNPTPAVSDFFGYAVAGVNSDTVLIGAYNDNAGASGAGAAYLFNTNGTLLTTFTNPAPASGEHFGYAVTAVGANKVLIGAREDSAGGTASGAAYLYNIGPTMQFLYLLPTNFIVNWPAAWTGFTLQSNPNPNTTNWVNVTNQPNLVGNVNQVSLPIAAAALFFRVSHP